MQSTIEQLLKSQAHIRRLYRDGFIDMALCEYDATIVPAVRLATGVILFA